MLNVGAEIVPELEGNICGTDMRGAAAPPWSQTTSRAKGIRRNLGDLVSDRSVYTAPARIGKARSRSR